MRQLVRQTLVRSLWVLAVLWVLWLVAANAVLNLAAVQDWIGMRAPECLALRRKHGFTWYPLRIGEASAAEKATVRGRANLDSFLPAETSVAALLRGLAVDTELDLPVPSLDFLRLYLPGVDKLGLAGLGWMRGRLHWEGGALASDTDLTYAR